MHKAEIAQVADGCDLNESGSFGRGERHRSSAPQPFGGGFSHFLTNLLIQYLTE